MCKGAIQNERALSRREQEQGSYTRPKADWLWEVEWLWQGHIPLGDGRDL